jgi:hypothetical protein
MGIGFIAVVDESTGREITSTEPDTQIIGSIKAAHSTGKRVVLSGVD